MSRDSATLLDVLRATRLILEFTRHMDEAAFLLGEAVKRLSDEFRAMHPVVPWSLMAGMRDRLIHAYDAVDLGEVWRTVTRDIPQLESFVASLAPAVEG